jgi:hypothetical protein
METPRSTANHALDAVSDKHVEILDNLQKQIVDALPLGTQMTESAREKLVALFAASRTSWETETKAAYKNVAANPEAAKPAHAAKH